MKTETLTNEQILKQAIEKAVKKNPDDTWRLYLTNVNNLFVNDLYYKLIFSHDFAKAFWGRGDWWCACCERLEPWEIEYKEKRSICKRRAETISIWTGHLQQMVLEKEPLKYLEKFL